ncbi:uncharacterized protein LOC132193157 isoform X2 [Neocloeon triangulifer]|uniref:uncharacterized protein LOC132193157 isoform X2 n=1 Tax=Neocloeon triangulifer TaxID=2078957 RepID=UPI00286ED821|nr:uncharacterized protein LOC132193157 isoform X2 [Neocloeon triangulifer]
MLQKSNEEQKLVAIRKMAKGIFSIRAELIGKINQWNTDDVVRFLKENNLSDCCNLISNRAFDGKTLLDSNDVSLSTLKKDIGMNKVRLLAQLVSDLKSTPEKYISSIKGDRQQTEDFRVQDQSMAYYSRERFPAPPQTRGRMRSPEPVDQEDEQVDYINTEHPAFEREQGEEYYNDDTESWGSDFEEQEAEYGNNSFHDTQESYVTMNPIQEKPGPLPPRKQDKPELPARPRQGNKICFDPLPLPPDRTVMGAIPPPSMDEEDEEGCYLDPLNDTEMNQKLPNNRKLSSPANMQSSYLGNKTVEPALPPRPKKLSLPDKRSEIHEISDTMKPGSSWTSSNNSNDDDEDYEQPSGQTPGNLLINRRALPLPPTDKIPDSNDPGTAISNVLRLTSTSGNAFGTTPSKLPVSSWSTNTKPPVAAIEKIPPSMKVPTTLSLSPAMPRHKIQQLGSPSQLQRPLPELPPQNSPPSIPSSLAPDLPVNAANSLKKAPWFFSIERLQAIQLLEDCGLDGCFLIRKSSQKDAVYTLSVMHKGRIYHIPIRKRADDLYALGKLKENEQAFPSVEGMVTFYSKEILKLYSGGKASGETLLKMSPSAERM